MNEENKITIKYQYKHVEDNDILNPKNIWIINKNAVNVTMIYVFFIKIIFSNCKCLLCSKCLQNHFNKCLTLFFIPSSDIGFICTVHNKKYEYFYTICNWIYAKKAKLSMSIIIYFL